jgi:Putative zinc-finger
MTARVMEHEEAIKNLTAERYLLGELTASDREAYEEHLFACAACFEQVKAGAEFVGHLRRVGVDAPQPAVAPGILSRLGAKTGQLATITTFGLALFVSGIAIHQNAVISRLKGPGPEIRSTLTGVAHGDDSVVKVTRGSRLSLSVEYAPNGKFISYQAQVLSGAGKTIYTVALPANPDGDMASIAMPAESLDPGQYSMVVFGRRSDGSQEEVGRGSFELRFIDK